jgi:hypothetical protein
MSWYKIITVCAISSEKIRVKVDDCDPQHKNMDQNAASLVDDVVLLLFV